MTCIRYSDEKNNGNWMTNPLNTTIDLISLLLKGQEIVDKKRVFANKLHLKPQSYCLGKFLFI